MKKIIILGHKNPDVDSIISGYLLEKILISKNINAKFIIPDKKISKESYDICLKYGIDANIFKGILSNNQNYFLVDHNERDVNGKIIGIIDHHPTDKVVNCDYYINNKACASANVIYDTYKDSYNFNKDEIKLIIIASIIDTVSFSSDKTREKDKSWCKEMCDKYNFNYDELINSGLCLTDLEQNDLYLNGLKEHIINNMKVESNFLHVLGYNEDIINKVIEDCKKRVKDNNLFMFLFIYHDMITYNTICYLITKDSIDTINYDNYASRGNTIIPDIKKRLIKRND